MAIKALFIANRGEIAVRIIKAAKALGVRTIQAVSAADKDMLAARLADSVVEIGPAHATKSYLNRRRSSPRRSRAAPTPSIPVTDSWPKMRILQRRSRRPGSIFVGPKPETIRAMGDKAAAREMAARAGVPTVPGSEGRIEGVEAARAAPAIGYPIMIKAAAGGGGRGIRVADTPRSSRRRSRTRAPRRRRRSATGALSRAIRGARASRRSSNHRGRREARSIFMSANARSSAGARKYGKRLPPPASRRRQREAVCASAVRLAKSVGYRGAGTLEYLYDEPDRRVLLHRDEHAHPGRASDHRDDHRRRYRAAMIRIAGGEPLPYSQSDIVISGHAIEVRINAEDPSKDFMPAPGRSSRLRFPSRGRPLRHPAL